MPLLSYHSLFPTAFPHVSTSPYDSSRVLKCIHASGSFGNVYHEGGPDPLAPAEADFFAMATLHSSLAERAQALDLAQCLNAAQRAQLLMALQQLGFPLTSLLPSQNASPVPETTKVQPGAAYLSSQAGTNIL